MDALDLGQLVFDAAAMMIAIIVITRMVGLRTFSKMSAFDFAITVATGSLLASVVVSKDTTSAAGIAALAVLLAIQALVARARISSRLMRRVVDNAPLLIMDGSSMLEENMRRAKLTRADLIAKLREANVLRLDQVQAVVFETTGDISVLHSDDDRQMDPIILEGVRKSVAAE